MLTSPFIRHSIRDERALSTDERSNMTSAACAPRLPGNAKGAGPDVPRPLPLVSPAFRERL